MLLNYDYWGLAVFFVVLTEPNDVVLSECFFNPEKPFVEEGVDDCEGVGLLLVLNAGYEDFIIDSGFIQCSIDLLLALGLMNWVCNYINESEFLITYPLKRCWEKEGLVIEAGEQLVKGVVARKSLNR